MRRLSLKLKLTLLYTFFMILVTCAALAILFSLSSREILASTQAQLEKRVQDSAENITMQDGELKIDSDFYSVTRDVYLSLYDEDLYFLYGRVPYGFDIQPEIADGQLRTIRDGVRSWYVYDMSFRVSQDYTVYIRGVTSVTDAEASFTVTIRFALILLPGMVLATALIGYRFTRRTLLPVKKITKTVQKIRADADLSRRIGLTESTDKTSGDPTSGQKSRKQKSGNQESRKRKNRDEVYELAETFDEMLAELETVFNREKQFTSDVSHELRTPVSVILAQCGACLEDESYSPRQKEQIMLIEKKAKDMSDMISHLLFLSRADQGRQPLHREWLNVSELTEMTAEEQQFLAEDEGRGVRIECEIEPDIYASVDETFYIRMLVNLISNAVTYSRENGRIRVVLSSDGKEVAGVIEDEGIGISEEDLPHIWERFYRADASRTNDQGANARGAHSARKNDLETGSSHSGLGLSMVKWIAEAHGGCVSVESTPGEGSTFRFSLPVGVPEQTDK